MGGDCLTLVNTIHIMFLLTPGLQHPAQTLRRENTYEDHVYLGFGLVLEITLCRGSVVFASTLGCQVLDRGTASFSRAGPLAKGQPSSCPTEEKAGWESTRGPWEHPHMLFLKCNGETQGSAVRPMPSYARGTLVSGFMAQC